MGITSFFSNKLFPAEMEQSNILASKAVEMAMIDQLLDCVDAGILVTVFNKV